tara:strand:+ start:335 stop:649 length:315 start_codon:yes stop_codon:yes gene_type:complete
MSKGLGCFVAGLATLGIWFVGIFLFLRYETYWTPVTFLILGFIPLIILNLKSKDKLKVYKQKSPPKTPPQLICDKCNNISTDSWQWQYCKKCGNSLKTNWDICP